MQAAECFGGAAAAREALFAAGIAGDSLAGRLFRLAAEAGEVFSMARYELVARLAASESGLRYALLRLAGAGLVTWRSVRGVLEIVPRLRLGERQRELFDQEPNGESQERVERQVVLPERGDQEAVVEKRVESTAPEWPPAEKELGAIQAGSATAQRESAAQLRRASALPASPTATQKQETKNTPPQVMQGVDVTKRWRNLCTAEVEDGGELARDAHSYSPFPPPAAQVDIPSGGNVEAKNIRTGVGRGGAIASLKRKISALVRLDEKYRWVAWSAALLAFDGPLSEHDLATCIEGSRGDGARFVGAIKKRLADVGERDPEALRRRSLLGPNEKPRLHRFDYLRPILSAHGIQLSDADTGLVRTRRQA